MSDLSSLIERVEAATGGDRELDAGIWLACTPGATRDKWSYTHKATGRECTVDETRDATDRLIIVPSYTTSIDAARSIEPTALCVFASDIGADGLPMVKVVTDTSTNPVIEYTGIAATLELAWCAAILRARQAADTEGQS